jgi:hypothetical protein
VLSEEYLEIQRQFNKVIHFSQNIEDPKTDELFERWFRAKKYFIEAFGGSTILEIPYKISFKLDDQEKNNKIEEFIDIVANNYGNEKLADFIELNQESFFDNIAYRSFDDKVQPGSKLVKSFKYYESDKDLLIDIQNHASRIIQEDKIDGTLCFSVNPLDFLSNSENSYNWRSCHSLDGDYRSGNLSYMTDDSTFICYLKGENNTILPNFPKDVKWNSKKWRTLLFLSEDKKCIMAGRQYPFTTKEGISRVLTSYLPESISHNQFKNWIDARISFLQDETDRSTMYVLESDYIPIFGRLIPMNEIVKNNRGSLQFNDLLLSSCYRPILSLAEDIQDQNNYIPHFYIGGSVSCLDCGKEDIELSETMRCNHCEIKNGDCNSDSFGYCDCCGTRILINDAYEVGDNEMVCSACYHSQCQPCERCGNIYYKSDMTFNRKIGKYLCEWCNRDIENGEPEDIQDYGQLIYKED